MQILHASYDQRPVSPSEIMKYDFVSVPDRSRCGSSKWDVVPGASVEKVPLSTADMEFPSAPQIGERLKELIDTTILGYTSETDAYYEAVCSWMKRRHHFDVDKEWIVTTPGVVFALAMLVEALSEPGDSVIIMNPVYYPFDLSIAAQGRSIVYNPLKLENGRYEIDFADLEEKASRPECKLLMFCSPHNPVGRVWSREELEKVVEICAAHDVFIIDDEIHNDLIMPGYQHTVLATVSEQAKQICAVCTAPSKTFNLAGVQCSNIIIPNPVARGKAQICKLMTMTKHLNVFAYTACQAAYNECEDWLEELIPVIDGNARYVTEFMAKHFPEVKVFPLEGTYLQWLDFRGLGMTHKELEQLMKEDAGLYLDEGSMFGQVGRGFERINLACSRVTLEKSMARFKAAMDRKREQWEREGRPYHATLAKGGKLEGFLYDTVERTEIDLAAEIQKPTILVFSRYFSCSICQTMLGNLRAAWPDLKKKGFDLKVVLQSTRESVEEGTRENPFPFDLICDPKARLYDRYNVFEADGMIGMVAGDPHMLEIMGGGIKQFAYASMLGGSGKSEGRKQQLPALFVVGPDMKVLYAHYSKTITDFPDLAQVLMQL